MEPITVELLTHLPVKPQPGSSSPPVYIKPASPGTRNTLFIGSPPLEAERNSNITVKKTCSTVFWKRRKSTTRD